LSYLLIHDQLHVGGIEALIVRMANWLAARGQRVALMLRSGGELQVLLDPAVDVHICGREFDRLCLPGAIRRVQSRCELAGFRCVMTFHPRTNWLATWLFADLVQPPLYLTGVYHPRAYFNRQNLATNPVERTFFRECFLALDQRNVVFMNEGCRSHHERAMKADFSRAGIWPMAIDTTRSAKAERRPSKHKIVSVGRLAGFKTYNLYMIDVVERLLDDGFDVTYDIYGYGVMEARVRRKIRRHGLADRITLHGRIDHERLEVALRDAYLFVGMGTCVLEAGMAGVPTVVAIENEPQPVSHGYLYEMEGHNVGECQPHAPRSSAYALIKRVFELSPTEYAQESARNVRHAAQYALDPLMADWRRRIQGAPRVAQKLLEVSRHAYRVLDRLCAPVQSLKLSLHRRFSRV
jgi:glycosyltransferase involved in cell wall biosynthesis